MWAYHELSKRHVFDSMIQGGFPAGAPETRFTLLSA
jgi:hypothetical protein